MIIFRRETFVRATKLGDEGPRRRQRLLGVIAVIKGKRIPLFEKIGLGRVENLVLRNARMKSFVLGDGDVTGIIISGKSFRSVIN